MGDTLWHEMVSYIETTHNLVSSCRCGDHRPVRSNHSPSCHQVWLPPDHWLHPSEPPRRYGVHECRCHSETEVNMNKRSTPCNCKCIWHLLTLSALFWNQYINVLGESSENETNAEHRTKMCRKLYLQSDIAWLTTEAQSLCESLSYQFLKFFQQKLVTVVTLPVPIFLAFLADIL